MEVEALNALRSNDGSLASLEAANARLQGARSAAEAAIVRLTETRSAALLLAGTAAVRQAETQLADAKLELEQIDALIGLIQQELPAAQRAKKIDDLRTEQERIAAMIPDLDRFGTVEYPKHAAAIVDGLKKLQAYEAKVSEFHNVWRDTPLEIREAVGARDLALSYRVCEGWPPIRSLSLGVNLPTVLQADEVTARHDPETHAWRGKKTPIYS